MQFYQYYVTSNFGPRTLNSEADFHNGIDFGLPLNTEVLSNISGTVEKTSYDEDGYGNYVVIKDGTGKLHYYAHLNKSTVNVGDVISVGDSIGLSGNTGYTTGPHLHYEVRDTTGYAIHPINYLDYDSVEYVSGEEIEEKINNTLWGWTDVEGKIKDKFKKIVFNIFKFIIIALLIILFVVFVTKALDINII